MNERGKITASHLSRQAIVYLRQSSPSTIANRQSGSMHLPKKLASSAGLMSASSSSTRTSVSLAPAGSRAPALRASPLRLRSPASGLFLDSRCLVSLVTMLTGTASSISPG
jgi:hypothetical protein